MSNRRPLWKQRTSFSKDRNVAVVLWPPGQYKDHPTPPSITLEEGKREGDTWNNTRITLTLDKAPNVIQNLQIAYAKALEIEGQQPETETDVAQKEMAKPTDQTKYLKTILLEAMQLGKIYSNMDLVAMAKVDAWVTDALAQEAINELLEQGSIRPRYEGLNLQGFSKPT
jgi:hypothetical protein